MSTWYTNYAEFSTGAVHGEEVAADVPTGVLCWFDCWVALDWAMEGFAGTGTYPRRYYGGIAISWVSHGAGRPTFNTGGDDDSWFVWGGLDSSGGQRPNWLNASSDFFLTERQWLKYQWRGARQITGAHDWWVQINLNETASPDTANQSSMFTRLGYW